MTLDPSRRREENYWTCRRSLRIRPVGAGNDMSVLKAYLRDCLKISDQSIETLGLDRTTVERVPFGPKSRHQKEMIVRFPTTEARDVVKASARNLASLGPDYGVRLEVPNHLKSAMQALSTVSFDIKQKHPGVRRNLLFDDSTQELVLDFCVAEGEAWRRVSSRQAKQARSRRKKGEAGGRDVGDCELNAILGHSGEEAGRALVEGDEGDESGDE